MGRICVCREFFPVWVDKELRIQIGIQCQKISNAEILRDKARKEAVANALQRAKLYAAAAGAEVGEVLSISEGVVGGRPRPVAMTMRAEGVPIERGTEMLQANVTITWALD